ncbi:MAG: acyl carrier protein [Flavobacteriales bacterium]|nr:acyl carrier protein [Flavobacteriales bacterium]
MIDIKEFIKILTSEFDIESDFILTPDTSFRSIKDWSSMHGLIIIAMADSEFGVTITGNDLRQMSTIQELYNLIKSRKEQ